MNRSNREDDEIKDDELENETRNDEEEAKDAAPEDEETRNEDCDKDETRTEGEDDEEKDVNARSARSAVSRRDHIFALCEVANLSITEARTFAASKMSLDEIRSKIMSKRSAKAASISNSRGVSNTSTKTLSQRAAEVYAKRK